MKIEYKVERWRELFVPQPAMLRYLLTNDGFEVEHWCDRPGIIYGPHYHEELQSHWIISGTLEIIVERVGTYELGPGDRDFMPAFTRHSARVIGDEPLNYLIGIQR